MIKFINVNYLLVIKCFIVMLVKEIGGYGKGWNM